jgi:hypothetical protein
MIQDLINDLFLTDGETKRINCPNCGGYKTFTITSKDGLVVWNCYKASCNAKGATPVSMSKDALITRITKPKDLTDKRVVPLVVPSHFSSYFPERMVRYMDKNNVTKAWREGRVELFHDVIQNRAVFTIASAGRAVDAVGRALGKGMKWYKYENTGEPFIAGYGETLYIVEDAASACAISHYGTAMALLGTDLSDRAMNIAKGYSNCVICLDKDASKKALSLTKRLKQFTDTTMRILKHDPKEYPEGVLA